MRRMIAGVALFFAALQAVAGTGAKCEQPDPTMRFHGPDLSLQDLERVGLEFAARNPKAPQVPFAYAHRNWVWLKAQYRPGDRLVAFEGPQGHDGQPFAWGYALVRGPCLVGLLTTRRA